MVVVSLKFPPRSKLVEECVSYFMEASEGIPQERVKPVVGDSLEAGWERSTEKEIVVSIDRYFVLLLAEM